MGATQNIDHIKVIGQITGVGGCGGNSYELLNGWVVSIPPCYFVDSNMNHIELGVKPDIEVINTIQDINNEVDRMLERAINE